MGSASLPTTRSSARLLSELTVVSRVTTSSVPSAITGARAGSDSAAEAASRARSARRLGSDTARSLDAAAAPFPGLASAALLPAAGSAAGRVSPPRQDKPRPAAATTKARAKRFMDPVFIIDPPPYHQPPGSGLRALPDCLCPASSMRRLLAPSTRHSRHSVATQTTKVSQERPSWTRAGSALVWAAAPRMKFVITRRSALVISGNDSPLRAIVRRRKESPQPRSFSRFFISTPVAMRKNMTKEWPITRIRVLKSATRKCDRIARGAPGTAYPPTIDQSRPTVPTRARVRSATDMSPRRGFLGQSTGAELGGHVLGDEQRAADPQALGEGLEVGAPETFRNPRDLPVGPDQEEGGHRHQLERGRERIRVSLEADRDLEAEVLDEAPRRLHVVLQDEACLPRRRASAVDPVEIGQGLACGLAVAVADQDERVALRPGLGQ